MLDLLVSPWEASGADRPSEAVPILIVIDALDENEGGSDLLRSLLNTVAAHKLKGLKFLVTSRPDPAIVTLCESFDPDAVCHLHTMEVTEVEKDINMYLQAALPALAEHEALIELARQARGLFIYAATVVRSASPPRKKTSKTEQLAHVQNTLRSWPSHQRGF